jgi:uncharacterized protein (TIRG00374 family)
MDPLTKKSNSAPGFRWGWKGFFLGVIVFAVLVYIGGVETLKTNLKPNLSWLALFLVANFMMFYTGSFRWQYISKQLDETAPGTKTDYFFYYMSGVFASNYIPKLGSDFLIRPAVLKRMNGVPYKKGFWSVVVEKNLDLLPLLILLGPCLLGLFNVVSFMQVLLISALFLGLTLYFFIFKNQIFIQLLTRLLILFFKLIAKIPMLKNRVGSDHSKRVEGLGEFKLFSRISLLVLLLLTVGRFTFMVLRLYILVKALSLHHITGSVLFFAFPISLISEFISFTPGSLGLIEGGWYALLTIAKIPSSQIVSFLIAHRLYHFVAASLFFLISYAAISFTMHYRRREKS